MKNYEHPGGRCILFRYNWQEISPLLHGLAHVWLHPRLLHTHSTAAFRILDKRLIGTLIDRQEKHSCHDRWIVFSSAQNNPALSGSMWKVIAKSEAASKAGCFITLKSSSKLVTYFPTGLVWIGRYFYINTHERRLINLCLSLSSASENHRRILLAIYDKVIEKKRVSIETNDTICNQGDELCFYVEKAVKNEANQYKICCDIDQQFLLEGPYV